MGKGIPKMEARQIKHPERIKVETFRKAAPRLLLTVIVILALFFLLGVMVSKADMVGYATYYNHGKVTRSGEPFNPNAMTCAVSWQLWSDLAGKRLVVHSKNRSIIVRVNDSGGWTMTKYYAYGKQKIGKYIVEWIFPSMVGLPIVVDLTPRAYDLLFSDKQQASNPVTVTILDD